MKVAIVNIPYPARLAMPMEKLGALELAYLVNTTDYTEEKFEIAGNKEGISIRVVDTSDISDGAAPEHQVQENGSAQARLDTNASTAVALLRRVRSGEIVPADEITQVLDAIDNDLPF